MRVAPALAAIACCAGAYAQLPINPNSPGGRFAIARFERIFTSSDLTLACDVQPQRPILTFNLRHYSGYRVTVPIQQLEDESTLTILFRVKPRGEGRTVYFRRGYRLPKLPRNVKVDLALDGGFLLGEGAYDVNWLLADRGDRACRKNWETNLRLSEKQRQAKQFLGPNSVAPLTPPVWRGASSGPERPFRISFLLHAAPLYPRSAMLSTYDQYVLTTTLITLLESTPFRDISVSAFNLQRQKEIFNTERLDGPALNRMVEALDDLQLGTIDVSQMANRRGNVDLLARLVNRELSRDNPPDAIVFLGPNFRDDSKFPRSLLEPVAGRKMPLFFYVHQDYFARRYPFPDPIEHLVKGQHGKLFSIVEPGQLIRAIRQMENRLRAEQRPN